MEPLRALVRGDGLDLELIGLDPMTGTLKLRLVAGPDMCQACVMSKAFLEEIALAVAQKANGAVRKIAITDERPISE